MKYTHNIVKVANELKIISYDESIEFEYENYNQLSEIVA